MIQAMQSHPASGQRSLLARLQAPLYIPLLVACVLTAGLQFFIAAGSPLIAKDGVAFIALAQQLEQSEPTDLASSQHTGYPRLILAVHRLLPGSLFSTERDGWIFAARAVAMTSGLLLVVFIWGLTRHLYSLTGANVAAMLAAGWPVLRENAADALSDTPHMVAYLGAAWLFCEGLQRRRAGWFVAAGTASGLAYWIRPEGWSIWLVGLLLLTLRYAVAHWRKAPVESRPRLGWGLALVVSALLISLPCLWTQGLISPKIADKLSNAQDATARLTQGDVSAETRTLTRARIANTSLRAVEAVESAHRNGSLTRALAVVITRLGERAHAMLALSLLTILVNTYQRTISLTFLYLLLLFVFHFLLLLWLFRTAGYVDRRHVIPMIAILLPSAGEGARLLGVGLARLLQLRGLDSPWLSPSVTWGMVGVFAVAHAGQLAEPLHQQHRGIYQTIKWTRVNLPSDTTVVTNSVYARFYLDHCVIGLPADEDVPGAVRSVGGSDYVLLLVDASNGEPVLPGIADSLVAHHRLFHTVDDTGLLKLPIDVWQESPYDSPAHTATRIPATESKFR